MPTVFRIGRYRFFFFSNEGREPIHIHVESGDQYAKFWINPVMLASSSGYSAVEINELAKLVLSHQELIKERWNEHFGRPAD